MDEMKLTKTELNEIKDDITFRVKTSERLKTLSVQLKKLNGVTGKVKVLETKVAGQFWLIGIIVGAIIITAVKSFAR